MGKGSHSQEKISGRKKQGCFGPPVTEMSPVSPFPYTVPAATASSLPPPLNVPYLQVVQDFFFLSYPFSFFLNFFSHSPWQLQGGGGRADGSSCLYVWDLCRFPL